ncbi:MAG: metallophosphoesterase [Nitrososphaeria archaeon]
MKVVAFGDLHFKKNILTPDKITGREYYREFFSEVLSVIDEQQPKAVVFLGDLYDRVSKIHPEVFVGVFDFFTALSYYLQQKYPQTVVLIVTGNHDMYNNSNALLKHLSLFGNILVDEPFVLQELDYDKKVYLYPLPYYMKDTYKTIEDLPSTGDHVNLYFSHLPLSDYEKIGHLSIESLNAFPILNSLFIWGHYHFYRIKGKFVCPGTPYGINFSDADKKDYCYVLIEVDKTGHITYKMKTIKTPYRFVTKEHNTEEQPYTSYRIKRTDSDVMNKDISVLINVNKEVLNKRFKFDFQEILNGYVTDTDVRNYLFSLLGSTT